jgi:hypothetical protein
MQKLGEYGVQCEREGKQVGRSDSLEWTGRAHMTQVV